MRISNVSFVLLSVAFPGCSHLEGLEDSTPIKDGGQPGDAGAPSNDAGRASDAATANDAGTASDASIVTPDAGRPRYDLSLQGLLIDNQNGLMWQRGIASPNPSCSGTTSSLSAPGSGCTWNEAYNYCNTARWEGRTWRLPTVAELQTLVVLKTAAPMIDTTLFPGTPPERFWTSEGPGSSNGYAVCFCSGNSYSAMLSSYYLVRCVSKL